MTKQIAHVTEGKKKVVKELTDLVKKKRTILVASIKNIPTSQVQEIVKKLRGKAVVKVPKKNLIFKALNDSGDAKAKEIESKINDSVAVMFQIWIVLTLLQN